MLGLEKFLGGDGVLSLSFFEYPIVATFRPAFFNSHDFRITDTSFLLPLPSLIWMTSRQLTTFNGLHTTSRLIWDCGGILLIVHSRVTLNSGLGALVTETLRTSSNGLKMVISRRACLEIGTSSKVTMDLPLNGRRSTIVGFRSSFLLFSARCLLGVMLH